MIVDGKKIAHELYRALAAEVKTLPKPPVLAAITCAPNFETQKYLELKKRKAADVGITLRVVELPESVTTSEAIACVEAVLPSVDGVVVQLPFPPQVDREALLSVIPIMKDPDGFAYGRSPDACLPPVVGAIAAIVATHQIDLTEGKVVVMGAGRLVGAPAATYLEQLGATFTVLTEETIDATECLRDADVIISGIGKPHFITVDKVKEGVIIFDAGTSEDGGVMVGDVHPDVAAIARHYTPVPGGIGPITVAALLGNLVSLIRQ